MIISRGQWDYRISSVFAHGRAPSHHVCPLIITEFRFGFKCRARELSGPAYLIPATAIQLLAPSWDNPSDLISLLDYSLRYNGSNTENAHKTYQERIDNKNKKESPAAARPYVTRGRTNFKRCDESSGHAHRARDGHRKAAGYLLKAYI